MKNNFPEYFPMSEAQIKSIWDNCTFVYDTNLLLDFYRYSEDTKNSLTNVLKHIQDRIWIPNQVASEFLNNRLAVISERKKALINAKDVIDKLCTLAKAEIPKKLNFRVHHSLDKNEFADEIIKALDPAREKIDKHLKIEPDLYKQDTILSQIIDLFENKVGTRYDSTELDKIFKDGKIRYAAKQPPGYEDAKEKGPIEQYGDLVIWKQIIDFAKQSKRNVIFVTSDSKGDWWWKHEGKIIGCRPELRAEFKAETKLEFHMYTADRFLKYAEDYTKIKIEKETLSEVIELRLENEQIEKMKNILRKIVSEGSENSANDRFNSIKYPNVDYLEQIKSADISSLSEQVKRTYLSSLSEQAERTHTSLLEQAKMVDMRTLSEQVKRTYLSSLSEQAERAHASLLEQAKIVDKRSLAEQAKMADGSNGASDEAEKKDTDTNY